jgi:AbrB family looped-hinge helix DNA binding protein
MSEHTIQLGKEGRILIPAAIRNQLGMQAGEPLTLSVVDGEVRIARRVEAVRRMQQRLAHLRDPDRPVVDELLRERRAEGSKE